MKDTWYTAKVLSFIVIDNVGITQTGHPYSSNYTDQFSNVAIFPFACTLVMPNLFGSINEVDSHKKSRQSDLVLEKFWVTRCGWLGLCTAVDMGTTITKFWKLFCYGFNRYHCEKLIGIRELLEFSQLILGPRQITYLPSMRSMKDKQFLLVMHFIFPVVFIPPQRPELFTT